MKVRACRLIQHNCYEEIKKAFDKYKLNFNDFQRKLGKCVSDDNYDEYELFIKNIVLELIDKNISPEKIEQLSLNLDNYYIQIMSRNFIVDSNDSYEICTTQQTIDFNILDSVGDFFIEFKESNSDDYIPTVIKVCKANYTITTKKHSNMDCWNCSVLFYDSSTKSTYCKHTFSFNEELHDKYLVDLNKLAVPLSCMGCENCNTLQSIINQDGGMDAEFCIVNNKKVEYGRCIYFDKAFSPQMILSLIAYVINMYYDRKNLGRKNSRNRKIYNKHKVHVATNNDKSKDVILDLNKYYQYEREHKEWQGGHHNSPVEHVRKEHTRVYRNTDGSIKKIVPVKATTVNKGGKKGVYHV